jgi:hypothetical protein
LPESGKYPVQKEIDTGFSCRQYYREETEDPSNRSARDFLRLLMPPQNAALSASLVDNPW